MYDLMFSNGADSQNLRCELIYCLICTICHSREYDFIPKSRQCHTFGLSGFKFLPHSLLQTFNCLSQSYYSIRQEKARILGKQE